jgi:opacity protein-like surface antigen
MMKFGIIGGVALLCVLSFASGVRAQASQGVHPDASPLQLGVGFTFVSFYEVPSTTVNNAGLNASLVYYHDYLGAEAQVSDAFGSQGGKTSQLLFTGGGIRLRWPGRGTLEPWVHGLAGYSHLSPKLSFGSDNAVGYKVGAGLDFNPHHSRIGYRVSADMFGSSFFKTYQLSPEVSAGIVLSLGKE